MGEDALFRQRYSHKDEWKGIGMRLHHQPRPHSANHDAGSALRIRGLGLALAYPVVDRWAGRWLGSDFDAALFDDRRHFRQLRISAACLDDFGRNRLGTWVDAVVARRSSPLTLSAPAGDTPGDRRA